MSEIIKTENLQYAYPAEDGQLSVPVLKGVNLSIKRGEFVAVLGHNGSGKSTLAGCFNAIRLPTGGVCYVDMMDTRDENNTYEVRKTVSMVFQNPDNQLVATVVEEDVAFALENMGVPPAEIRKRVDDALRAVGMYEYRAQAPHRLSGGQKQRIAIAGVIAMMPRCVVLDEPTAMLDPQGRREVMNVVRELNRKFGITVILITHHMDEAVQAQRVVVMHKGNVLMDGAPREIFTQVDKLRAASLTVPQTIEVLYDLDQQDGEKLLGITGAETTEHYRNKAQYPVVRDREGNIVTGFYRPRSHDIVPVEKCLIQSETADKIAAVVREWMTEFSVMPYDYEKKRGTIRHIYVRVGEKSGESQLTLISATKKMPKLDVLVERLRAAAPSLTGILLNHNQRDDNVILGNRTDVLWGEPMLEDRLCGHTFLLSPEAFYQVNHAQAERLYACAVDYAGLTGEETVLDLYCGAGTITLALAEHAKTAIGVEIVPEAIENAKRNALRNGMENTEFFCADAGQAAQRLAKCGIDVLVVDPPRKGLDATARDAILKMQPPKVVYVSCDPATLARDVAELCGAGYTLEKAQAYDLFPRTFHVETVALLTRTIR